MPGFGECRNALPVRFTAMGKAWNFGRKPETWRDEISGGDVSAAGSPAAMSACGRRPAI
jgi:hypothetical protein